MADDKRDCLDPQARGWLDQLAARGFPAFSSVSVDEARRIADAQSLLARTTTSPVEVDVSQFDLPGPVSALKTRRYAPKGRASPLPIIVYFHGGGWVIGNLDRHDALCRRLAVAAECVVLSVDYRLAPEHPFPAAVEDAYAATDWIASHAAELGGDAAALVVAGDSSGGNLAAVVALAARDAGRPSIAMQVLFYPVMEYSFDTASYRDYSGGFGLTEASMRWYWGLYLPRGDHDRDPRASPIRAKDLNGLPPTLIVTAECDPLRDEAAAFAGRLRSAGVRCTYTCYAGMIHGFLALAEILDWGREALTDTGRAIQAELRSAPDQPRGS